MSFSRYSYYVYVTDKEGNPVPLETITSVRVAKLKKVFQSELNGLKERVKEETGDWPGFHTLTVEEKRPAGEAALAWLEDVWKEGAKPTFRELAPVTFHQVNLEVDEGQMRRLDQEIATR